MQDKQRIWGLFAHASIIIGMMFVVFFIIDRVNPAMEFLTSSLSKWLMLLLALCSIIIGLYSAIFLFQRQKRRDEKRSHPQTRPAREREEIQQQRLVQQYLDPRTTPQQRQTNEYVPSREYGATQMRQMNRHPQQQLGYPNEQSKTEYERRDPYQR